MSIALGRRSDQIQGSGCMQRIVCAPIGESTSLEVLSRDRILPAAACQEEVNSCSSSRTSSLGRNSDLSSRRSSDGEEAEQAEVQSAYKDTFCSMDALEEVLPMRRGISTFYNGKSKSFASLVDATSFSSIKEIAKSENAYSRKRRNLLASGHLFRNLPLRSGGGGISKRLSNPSRSTLALAVAMSSSERISTSEGSNSNSCLKSCLQLPPLHPQARSSHGNSSSSPPPPWNFSPRRSLSLADLRQCATVTASSANTNGSSLGD